MGQMEHMLVIPFAYDYGDKDNDPDPGNNESLTHGTHVAGIIGANGGDVIRGVSPDAQIVPMKVADDALGLMYDSDIIAAIEDAVTLGVDAINMSLGSDAGFPEDSNTTYANVYNSVKNANIILNVAAGNAYDAANNNLSGQSLPYVTDPDSSIIASPSTYGASLSVASVNALSAIKYFITSDGGKIEYAPSDAQAPSLGSLNGSIELVDCGYGHVDEIPDTVSGKIALIKRGSNIPGEQFYYSTKVDNVNNKGAVAAVVYNNMSSNDGLLQ
jgi:lactocepin